jgi:hypothetical protein
MTRRRYASVPKRVAVPTEVHDVALQRLEEKLHRWLMQQPEWIYVLSADRATRKRYERMVARAATSIPPYITNPPPQPKPLNINVGGGGSDSRPERRPAPVASEPPPAPLDPGRPVPMDVISAREARRYDETHSAPLDPGVLERMVDRGAM